MHILVTGATGWIGSMVVRDLIAEGHEVTGIARSESKAESLRVAGAHVVIGELADIQVLRSAAEHVDGVIHTAFGLDLSKLDVAIAEDRKAIETFGEVFAGSQRPLIVTDGFLHEGKVASESDRPVKDPTFPRASQQTAFEQAQRGVHANVVRNPRSVHGKGETHGFVPMLASIAKEKGVSAYIGSGDNRWPAVHRNDCARVYCQAIKRGARGEAYHAVGESGVAYREIAEAIGRQVGMPAKSLTLAEAEEHFGPIVRFIGNDGPASNEWTRKVLDWTPREPSIVSDIDRADYSVPAP